MVPGALQTVKAPVDGADPVYKAARQHAPVNIPGFAEHCGDAFAGPIFHVT